jgi:hypothetical protein
LTDTPDLAPLSIVIVSYNTRRLLLACVASIYAGASLPVEVIVVDNGSTDGSADAIRAQFPQVRLIANRHNAYFSAGNNQGIWAATGRYVLALNPDTLVRGDTLRQLVAQMDADPHLGAATTMQYTPDGRLQHNGSRFPTYWHLLVNYTFVGKLLAGHNRALNAWLWYADWDRRTPRQVDVLPGSCILARRDHWRQIGGFAPSMPMYFSDDYFSLQVQCLGLQTRYLCSDGIVHYEGMSAKQVSAWSLRQYLHDLVVYARLRFGWGAAALLMVLLLPTWLVQRVKARR